MPDYDIFERLPDGSPMWRKWVDRLEKARTELNLLASKSKHEFFALHTPTGEIVIRVNASDSKV